MSSRPPVFVTKPFLPPIEEYVPYLEEIWRSGILTNMGPFHEKLESALLAHLQVLHLALVANCTLGLFLALEALDLEGEVVTTPFTFPATVHALRWKNLTPVFADIEPGTFNIDPARIEAAITPRTRAILAVHVYGLPCRIDAIQAIADRHGLKVVYDAAHAFDVTYRGKSLAAAGDISVLSFHATKSFTTAEGGAVITPHADVHQRIRRLRNFGILNEVTVADIGLNAKMSELHAAFGLLQLKYIDKIRSARAAVDARYREGLDGIAGISFPPIDEAGTPNHAYFPILVGRDYPLTRDALDAQLRAAGFTARRYFYPLASTFPMYKDLVSAAPANLAVAHRAADTVLCLPLFSSLSEADQDAIVHCIAAARL